MDKVNAKIGTDYKLFNYYGAEDAEQVIIAMGSVNDTIEETIDYMIKTSGAKVGVVKVRLYRPFCAQALIDAIPATVKKITVSRQNQRARFLRRASVSGRCCSIKGQQVRPVRDLLRTLRFRFQGYNSSSDRCCLWQ